MAQQKAQASAARVQMAAMSPLCPRPIAEHLVRTEQSAPTSISPSAISAEECGLASSNAESTRSAVS